MSVVVLGDPRRHLGAEPDGDAIGGTARTERVARLDHRFKVRSRLEVRVRHPDRDNAIEPEVPPRADILRPGHDVRPHARLGYLVWLGPARADGALRLAGVVEFQRHVLTS